jgi:hypothetical protein
MTRVNLMQSKVAVKPVPKLNTLEYSIYLFLLVFIVSSVLGIGLYTMYLINTTNFKSIIGL